MAADTPMHPQSCFDFEVFCPLDGSHLNVLRRFVTCVAQEMGFPADEISKIEIAVDEACSNVLLHAYNGPDESHGRPGIEMRLNSEPDSLVIQVQDHGCGRLSSHLPGVENFEEYARPDRGEYRGLGILIMKEFMDEVLFISKPHEGTVVTLRKNIQPQTIPVNPSECPPG